MMITNTSPTLQLHHQFPALALRSCAPPKSHNSGAAIRQTPIPTLSQLNPCFWWISADLSGCR